MKNATIVVLIAFSSYILGYVNIDIEGYLLLSSLVFMIIIAFKNAVLIYFSVTTNILAKKVTKKEYLLKKYIRKNTKPYFSQRNKKEGFSIRFEDNSTYSDCGVKSKDEFINDVFENIIRYKKRNNLDISKKYIKK